MPSENDPRGQYRNPLVERYASRRMAALFSERVKFTTWRRLWLVLAECEAELGLSITAEQLDQMRAHVEDIDFEAADAEEARRRHDVMAHVHAYGLAAPKARPIIHLGATSAYVTDNADALIVRDALRLLAGRVAVVLGALAAFARKHRDLACLGATHLQPAQPVTAGKRACLWAHDFLLDLREITRVAEELPCRGVKGTTGTQASFLELFGGDHGRVRALDRRVAERLDFTRSVAISGQTITRKLDTRILGAVAGVAESAAKLSSDVRLLQGFGELAEPMGSEQTGSSAMPYKRNPMRSERMASLSRLLLALPPMAAQTAGAQWLERTLDDSALRRIVVPEAFLAADAILLLAADVAGGLEVFPRIIARRLEAEIPFVAAEVILMEGVKAGGDRQTLHEALREHSRVAAHRVRVDGESNDLLQRLGADARFAAVKDLLPRLAEPSRFVGRAPQQVDEFLAEELEPALAEHARFAATWGLAAPDDEPGVRV